jgi:hypothetical protein
VVKESVEPLLDDYRPPGIKSLKFSKFSLGTVSPKIEGFLFICFIFDFINIVFFFLGAYYFLQLKISQNTFSNTQKGKKFFSVLV